MNGMSLRAFKVKHTRKHSKRMLFYIILHKVSKYVHIKLSYIIDISNMSKQQKHKNQIA